MGSSIAKRMTENECAWEFVSQSSMQHQSQLTYQEDRNRLEEAIRWLARRSCKYDRSVRKTQDEP